MLSRRSPPELNINSTSSQSESRVTVVVALCSGIGTWLFGGDGVHIGSSGIIYGYFAFLLLRGFFEKSLRWVMVALIVGFTLYGMLDFTGGGNREISWCGHLFGFAGGALAAWLFFYRARESKPAGTAKSNRTQ